MSSNQHNEEEVDLGSLFKIIGKGFSNVLNFIGNIFKEIFHLFIMMLLFLKKNVIKISIPTIIGFSVGMILELKKTDIYQSELIVQPNFNATRQLYNTINYYNNLISQRDTISIARIFNFDIETAKSLEEFVIEPIKLENDILHSYDEMIQNVDSLSIRDYSYKTFKKTFTDFEYYSYKIKVFASKNDVFSRIGKAIVSSIQKNVYFIKLKNSAIESLNRSDSLYRQNLVEIDSLRKVYIQVMLEEAKKQKSNGTNIDLGDTKSSTKEIDLFKESKEYNTELNDVLKEKAEKIEILNVISEFQPIGKKIEGVSKNYAFILAVLGAGLIILFILLLQLNKYLDTYKK